MQRASALPISFCLLLIIAGSASGADPISPAGTWKWETKLPNRTLASKLKLKFDGQRVTGQYTDQFATVDVAEGTFVANKITLRMETSRNDRKIKATFTGNVKDAKIEGTVKLEVAGQVGERAWIANRVLEPDDIAGIWNFKFTSPDGKEHKPSLKVEHKAKKYAAVIFDPEGELKLEDFQVKDNTVTFSMEMQYDGSPLKLSYTLRPRGEKIYGQLAFDLAGETGNFPVTAARQPPQKKPGQPQ